MKMKKRLSLSSLSRSVIVVSCAMLALPLAVASQPLDLPQAKKEGLVGERPDGLVAAVPDDPSAEVRKLVDRINEERMASYEEVAQKTDTSLEAVQARAGKQIISRLPEGHYFMDAAGRWRQK